MRIFERWDFGLCWNLRLLVIIELPIIISWRILILILEDFVLKIIFFCALQNNLSFQHSSFPLRKLLFNVNGKVTMCDTPLVFTYPKPYTFMHSYYVWIISEIPFNTNLDMHILDTLFKTIEGQALANVWWFKELLDRQICLKMKPYEHTCVVWTILIQLEKQM
jgi:hypothetical protein